MTLTAVLFTGGESRRMGTDKAKLMFEGELLWFRQLRTLRAVRPARILISARTTPSWQPAGVDKVLDEAPGRGPMGGLVVALREMQTTHLLALAVDLPFMTAAHLERIWRGARPGCGVVPVTSHGPEPLCAIYPAESMSAARTALDGGELSMRRLVRGLAEDGQVQYLPIPDRDLYLYRNLNTPSELLHAV